MRESEYFSNFATKQQNPIIMEDTQKEFLADYERRLREMLVGNLSSTGKLDGQLLTVEELNEKWHGRCRAADSPLPASSRGMGDVCRHGCRRTVG